MALTFRSTIPERVMFLHQDCYGQAQLVEATRPDGERDWAITQSIPNGQTWEAKYSGDVGLYDAITEFANSHRNDFIASRGNDHRPRQVMRRDYNMVVDEGGNVRAPTITGRYDR
jgi:hypothetical protein